MQLAVQLYLHALSVCMCVCMCVHVCVQVLVRVFVCIVVCPGHSFLQTVRIATGLSSTQHTIEIYQDTEAKNPNQPGYATLKKIVLNAGGELPGAAEPLCG